MLPRLSYATTSDLARLSVAEREAVLALSPTRDGHAAALRRHRELFDRLELRPSRAQHAPPAPFRVACWNIERGKYLSSSAERLAALNADACLLCELDHGMARSGQAHTARELADALNCGYAFGTEFLELGLGDRHEQREHRGDVNDVGIHGAAILSRYPLVRPALIRLEAEGDWFDGERGERRVGGRIAMVATFMIGDSPITLVNVHIESHSGPAQRAAQTKLLLDAIETYAADQPVVLGGDFNTSTLDRDWARGNGTKPVLPSARVLDPTPHEPLFEVMADYGYDWRGCNVAGAATQRTRTDGTPKPPLGKIDWFFARNLDVSDPCTLPAVDATGHAISDHEILLLTVAPRVSDSAQERQVNE